MNTMISIKFKIIEKQGPVKNFSRTNQLGLLLSYRLIPSPVENHTVLVVAGSQKG